MMPRSNYDSSRNFQISPGMSKIPVARTTLESDKNYKKIHQKTKMAITRATRRPRSSRDVHFVAFCARIRLEWIPVTKTSLESNKNDKKLHKKSKKTKFVKKTSTKTNKETQTKNKNDKKNIKKCNPL